MPIEVTDSGGSHNYAADYALHTIEMVARHFGEQTATNLVRMAMRFLAVQYIGEFARQIGVTGKSAHGTAEIASAVLSSFRNDVDVAKRSDFVTELTVSSFAPFNSVATEDMRAAIFAFFEMGTRVISGRLTARRFFDVATGTETWRFEDHRRWMA